MPKYFFAIKIEDDIAHFDEHECNHLRVMRLSVGSRISFTDGRGFLYDGELCYFGKHAATAFIKEKWEYDIEPSKKVHIYISNTKWQRESILIEKAVELGVSSLNFVQSERSVKRDGKKEKIDFLVRKALKQCGGTVFPEIRHFDSIHEVENVKKNGQLSLFLNPYAEIKLDSYELKNFETFRIFIGPEGGYTDEEILYLKTSGILGYNIGSRILRSETAVISILSLIILS